MQIYFQHPLRKPRTEPRHSSLVKEVFPASPANATRWGSILPVARLYHSIMKSEPTLSQGAVPRSRTMPFSPVVLHARVGSLGSGKAVTRRQLATIPASFPTTEDPGSDAFRASKSGTPVCTSSNIAPVSPRTLIKGYCILTLAWMSFAVPVTDCTPCHSAKRIGTGMIR